MSVLSKKLLKFRRVRHVMDNFRCNRLWGALVRSISLELPLNDGSRSTQAVETKYMVRYMIVEPGTIEEDVEILSFIYQHRTWQLWDDLTSWFFCNTREVTVAVSSSWDWNLKTPVSVGLRWILVGEAILCCWLDRHCQKELDVLVWVRWEAWVHALFTRPTRGRLFAILIGSRNERKGYNITQSRGVEWSISW